MFQPDLWTPLYTKYTDATITNWHHIQLEVRNCGHNSYDDLFVHSSFAFLLHTVPCPFSSYVFACFHSIKWLHQFVLWPWHWQNVYIKIKRNEKNRLNRKMFSTRYRKSLSLWLEKFINQHLSFVLLLFSFSLVFVAIRYLCILYGQKYAIKILNGK